MERDLVHPDTAIKHYESAAALHRDHGNRLSLAHTIRHIADIYLDTGSPERAEPFYREALEIYRHTPGANPLDVANMLRGYALAKGQDPAAQLFWTEARELYREANVPQGAEECTRRLSLYEFDGVNSSEQEFMQ